MKTFYDKDFRHMPEAIHLIEEVRKLLEPLFEKYVEMGYSPRELSHLLSGSVLELELKACLSPKVKQILKSNEESRDNPFHNGLECAIKL